MAHKRSRRRPRLVLSLFTAALVYAGCGLDAGPSAPTQSSEPQDIKKLYGNKCGICHGVDGSMQNAGAKDLSVSVLAREEIIHQIKFGKGTMPPMNKVLDDATIEQLADYTIGLRKTNP